MKFFKKMALLGVSCLITIPVFGVVSCGQNDSLETKLKKLLDQDNLFEVTLNPEVKNFNDLFSSNIQNPIIIEPTNAIKEWNQNVSNDLYLIDKYDVCSIEIPTLSSLENKENNEIVVYINVDWIYSISSPKIKTFKINLDDYKDFNKIIENNNLIDNSVNNNNKLVSIMVNNYLKLIIEKYIKDNNITIDSLRTDSEILNINLPTNSYIQQDNLYIFWDNAGDPIAGNSVSLYVYANSSILNDLQSIRNKCLYFKIDNISF